MNIKNRLSHIREIYKPFYGHFLVLAIIVVGIQITALTSPYFYGRIIDGFIKMKPMDQLMKYAFIMMFILMMKAILELIHGRQHVGKIAFDIEDRISEVTLRKVLKLSLGQILNHNSGFKQDIIKKGEQSLMEMVELFIFDLMPTILRTLVAIISLFVLNVYLGAITFCTIVIFFISSYVINKKIMPELKRQTKMGNKIGTSYWEIIKHLRLVIINNQEDQTIRGYAIKYGVFSARGKKLWFLYFNMVTWFRDPFGILGQFSVLAMGIYLVHFHKVTPGNLVMAMAWSMMAFQAMGNMGSLQRRISRYSVQVGRYFDFLEIPPAITMPENPIRSSRFNGRIEFRNVSFKYPTFEGSKFGLDDEKKPRSLEDEHVQAIEDVSFEIEPGTTCAFVGHSGAGKSTVINLLLRGYDPDKGEILIDGNKLSLLHLGDWRKAVGCVEQEPKLWDDTLRFNMTYGLNGQASEFDEDALLELAEKTRIGEFYSRLGNKPFETEIGENGVQLSGGQRQRVAIARAVAKSPSIIILDEATNALDPVNEQLIHQAIKDALVGRTGIIIAHRLSTIRHADQIIVFEKGRIVGKGKHESLMGSCAAYQTMVQREIGTLSA
jgi:ATP-binding cassette subfamily B protein